MRNKLENIKVLVCGGRNFDDYDYLADKLDALDGRYAIDEIIQGEARGADALAERWAKLRAVKCTGFRAEWSTYGRRAGPLRNLRMLQEGRPDLVVAFAGGKGTANMISQAKAAGVRVINYA